VAALSVDNIEVVYDHVVLVLKGVSLSVPRGRHRRPARRERCRQVHHADAISNLLHAERGEVTKGSISFRGREVHRLTPNELVGLGCIQVMEGRHCFGHLSVEENLLTGAFTRKEGRAAVRQDLEMVYGYFPR
jgi:branched-chain amino acid transport system ATP-binding protein